MNPITVVNSIFAWLHKAITYFLKKFEDIYYLLCFFLLLQDYNSSNFIFLLINTFFYYYSLKNAPDIKKFSVLKNIYL